MRSLPEAITDAVLLEAFVTRREEAAFMELVERHGPLVERACRRILRNEHDVADAFQGTFMVLAGRADAVLWCDSVAGWLTAVARRLALRIRSGQLARTRRERTMTDRALNERRLGSPAIVQAAHPFTVASDELEQLEVKQTIHAELERLPEKYRAAVVLCDLEGLTHHEAARRLGWPSGSLSRRLGKARSILRHRLASKGFTLALVGLVSAALLWGLNRPDREPRDPNRTFVRQVMTSFGHGFGPSDSLHQQLGDLARKPAIEPDREQAQAIGRQAVAVALAIADHPFDGPSQAGETDARRNEWRSYALVMEQSAHQLILASGTYDPAAITSAARGLEASCVSCHRAFRVQ